MYRKWALIMGKLLLGLGGNSTLLFIFHLLPLEVGRTTGPRLL